MTVYSYSGKGNRETNEDYIRSVQFDNNTSLHIVADGMGGYLYGEIAAQVATNAIVQYLSERNSVEDITSTIQQAVEFANEEKILSELGPDKYQGFFFGHPVNAFDFYDQHLVRYEKN